MISAAEALKKVLRKARRVGAERVPLAQALGRVLAKTEKAGQPQPLFDNSTMDGFAVRTRDAAARVIGVSAAGRPWTGVLKPGSAVKIMTGAPIPRGAQAVVMKELVEESDGWIKLLHRPKAGEWIRKTGEDLRKGAVLIAQGRELRPMDIGLLAGQGIDPVLVFRKPIVAVLSTGTELSRAKTLKAGQIRDANGPAIAAAVRAWGAEALELGAAPDSRAVLANLFLKGIKRADMIVTSGGVSVGEYDLLPSVLEALGFKKEFWRVSMKPGKPVLFGTLSGKPVFGLPGNPASVLCCLELFVRPALAKMRGLPPAPSFPLEGRAANAFDLPRSRQQFLFCAAKGAALEIITPQASHMLGRVSRANALAEAPAGAAKIRPGDRLPFRYVGRPDAH